MYLDILHTLNLTDESFADYILLLKGVVLSSPNVRATPEKTKTMLEEAIQVVPKTMHRKWTEIIFGIQEKHPEFRIKLAKDKLEEAKTDVGLRSKNQ
jgi:hypothetical protein